MTAMDNESKMPCWCRFAFAMGATCMTLAACGETYKMSG